MTSIILTGAYGLIGTTLCDILPRFIPDAVITKVKFDEGIALGLGSVDMIVHAAGYGQPLKFTKDKVATILVNVQGTNELFKYLKPKGKFLFISTSEVYSGAIPPYTEDILGTTNPSHPRACYIESKRCGEAICHAYKDMGFNVKIVRLSLAYGPTKLGDTRVLNQFIEQGLKKKIVLRDSGAAVRTYCYVQDACELILKILLQGKDVVYNVGGFSTITIAELAKEIGRLMNATVTIPQENKGLQDAPRDVSLDMTHTLTEFNQNFTSLDKGLKLTIAKYK